MEVTHSLIEDTEFVEFMQYIDKKINETVKQT